MPKALVIGNGSMLLALDDKLMIRDLYYPHVGMEDHTTYQHFHRIGLWIDQQFTWLYEDSWQTTIAYKDETLVSDCTTINQHIGIKMIFNDCVLDNANIFIRKITFQNLKNEDRQFRIFFSQDFHLYGDKLQDTALYEPVTNSMIHYRKRRYFMVNGSSRSGKDMVTYTTGKSEYQGFVGTWKDAEDGSLQRNAIAQGSVDSTVGFEIELKANGAEIFYFWICAGKKFSEINRLNLMMITDTPEKLMEQTEKYWRSWVNKRQFFCQGVSTDIVKAFKQSLLIIRTQIDNDGAIIAANDSDIMKFNKDTYTYMWPRDGAMVALVLDATGYGEITKRFFQFCSDVVTDGGFLLHKYNPDKSLGSSWHPWFRKGRKQLPIQEDETALVIYALWNHYHIFKDLEFVRQIYDPLVIKGAEFLFKFFHPYNDLPLASYDLWEEHLAVSTFTCSAVYAGLKGAANLAQAMGDEDYYNKYQIQAEKLKAAILEHLWDPALNRFLKHLICDATGHIIDRDSTIESSTMGIYYFNVLPENDPRVIENMRQIKDKLTVHTDIGGLARFQKDFYQKTFSDSEFDKIPGNPWFITTLWYAQWLISLAKTEPDLTEPLQTINWCLKHSNSAFIMSEQLDPYSGAPVSVAPLTWSQATFVETVMKYCKKLHLIKGIAASEIMKVVE
jgi:oligosaccharide amylase